MSCFRAPGWSFSPRINLLPNTKAGSQKEIIEEDAVHSRGSGAGLSCRRRNTTCENKGVCNTRVPCLAANCRERCGLGPQETCAGFFSVQSQLLAV